MTEHELQTLWQAQPQTAQTISLEDLRGRSRRFAQVIAFRNLLEYLGAAIVVGAFVWAMSAGVFTVLERTGVGLLAAAAVLVAFLLHRWGTATAMPSELALTSALEFHRAQLTRQRDLLRSVWWWYLLPFMPGLVVAQVAAAIAHPDRRLRLAVSSAVMIALTVAVYALNRRGANTLQQRLDRLEAQR